MDLQSRVIRNIKHLMTEMGISGNRLADRSGLSSSYVAKLLGGKPTAKGRRPTVMTLPTLEKLAAGLGVDPVNLLAKPRVNGTGLS